MAWQPRAKDQADVLADQNPWRTTRLVPPELTQRVRRPLSEHLWRALMHPAVERFQLILGPRRVGKTTTMYQTVARLIAEGIDHKRLIWLRLDHPILMQKSLDVWSDSRSTRRRPPRRVPVYLFLDELTYADRWDLWLKTFYDDKWPIRLVATSSTTAALRDRRLESGIGRWEEQYLAPYLFPEYLALRGHPVSVEAGDTLDETIDRIVTSPPAIPDLANERRRFLLVGGFPELLNAPPAPDEQSEVLRSQRILRSDAIERAIYKDIPQAFGVHDPMRLERLLYTLAGQVAGIVSPASLCADMELSRPTLSKYIDFFERSFITFMVPNYAATEESIQRRGRKLYFVDGAVRNAALLRGIAPLTDPKELGLLYENAPASHLHALAQQAQVRAYHWRDGKTEVDLLYDDPHAPLAFEVASSASHHVAGLAALAERHKRFRGRTYLVYPDALPIRPAPDAPGQLPLDVLLLAIGVHAQAALARRFSA